VRNIEVTPDIKKEYEEKGDVLPEWIMVKEPIEEFNHGGHRGEEKKIGIEEENPLFSSSFFLLLPPCNSVFSVVFILPLS
jgi:hypothetical protein